MIRILNEKRFFIFKIENFISNEDFNTLLETFPHPNINDLINCNNKKYSFKSDSDIFLNLINKNSNLKNIYQKIKKKTNILFTYKLFWRVLKARHYNITLLLKYILHILKLKNYFETSIEYSYIFNEGCIEPHLDGRKKLISLMLYLPENFKSDEIKKKQDQCGTSFLINNDKREINEHLNNKEEIDKLIKKSEILKVPFEKKNLYGFIKNNYSWHLVDEINVDKSYIRKSINININLK